MNTLIVTLDKAPIHLAHEKQILEYEEKWTIVMDEFEQNSRTHMNELSRTHQEQLDALKTEMVDIDVQSKPDKKWSIELIDLREKQGKQAELPIVWKKRNN